MDLSFKEITVRVPGKILIQSDLVLIHGVAYALVGKNGCGKSTLLKQISTREIPIPNSISMFLVDQEMDIDLNKSVYDVVAESNLEMIRIKKRIKELEELFMDDNQLSEYTELTQTLQSMDYMRDESIIRRILYGLGFLRNVQDRPVKEFSGGWRMRASIARGLYMCPDLLLLDEPTNHLDLEAVIWLMNELTRYKKTLLFVSHDAWFIDGVAKYVVEVDSFSKQLIYYRGDYEYYKHARDQKYLLDVAKWEKNQAAIVAAKKKHKTPPVAYPRPPKRHALRFKVPAMPIPRQIMILLNNCSAGYDERVVLSEINLAIEPQARIAFVGKNGCGKSTLLNLLAGNLITRSGEAEIIPDTRIGYYSQHLTDSLPAGMTPVHFILQKINASVEFARELLGVTGLESSTHVRELGTLSGGQRARVLLASIIALRPHVMLLDEPTNHLDIDITEALIEFINNYNGAVIISTHNMELLLRTHCMLFEIHSGKLFTTTIEQYQEKILAEVELEGSL